MLNKKSLLLLIEDAHFWEVTPDGLYLHLLNDHVVSVSKEEVDQVDARIVPYLESFKSANISLGGILGVRGVIVDRLLEYWQNPDITLLRINSLPDYQVAAVTDIKLTPNEKFVNLAVEVYIVEQFEGKQNGVLANISYGTTVTEKKITVPRTLLDTAYPDWRARWLALEALEIPYNERARHMFSNQVAAGYCPAELPPNLSING